MKYLIPQFFIVSLLVSCVANNGGPKKFGRDFSMPSSNSEDEKNEGPSEYAPEVNEWHKEIKKFTGGYKTFPSSGEVTNYLNNQLSSPNNPCEGFEDSYGNKFGDEKSIHPAAFGARKVLAAMFQSCKALTQVIDDKTPPLEGVTTVKMKRGSAIPKKRKITNTKAYVDSHIVLNKLKEDKNYPGEKCEDVTKKPPVYGYGSRKAPNKSGVLNLSSSGAGVISSSKPAAGIDCSAFISTALGTQGLKVSKKAGPFTDNTTRSFHSFLGSKNSCLKRATYSEDQSIVPGDMINVAGSHIVMVDSVGEDPLAIKRFAKSGNCNSISVKDFDFTYIHSGNINNSYGPSRVHISKHSGGTMWNNLRTTAVKMCKRIVEGKKKSVSMKSLSSYSKFSVIRHNTTDPDCVSNERIKLRNEECVDGCLKDQEEKVSNEV